MIRLKEFSCDWFLLFSTFKALNKSQIFEKQLLFKHRVLSLVFHTETRFDQSTENHNPFSLYHWEIQGEDGSFADSKLLFHITQTMLHDCVSITTCCPVWMDIFHDFLTAHFSSSSEESRAPAAWWAQAEEPHLTQVPKEIFMEPQPRAALPQKLTAIYWGGRKLLYPIVEKPGEEGDCFHLSALNWPWKSLQESSCQEEECEPGMWVRMC